MNWRILLCHDGSPSARNAEAMLKALRLIPAGRLDVLAVVEAEGERRGQEAGLTATIERLAAESIDARPVVRSGHAAEEILHQAEAEAYDLVATGAHGRRGLTRFLLGSTTGRLARHLETSLLVCRRPAPRVEQVLICSGGEATSLATLETGGRVAAHAGADVSLLHVMSQVGLSWESPSDDLAAGAEAAIARGSREGDHLRRGLELLRQVGLGRDPRPVLRHGLVVDEVIAELEAAGAQLLVVGAHRALQASGAYGPLLDDITDQLLTHAPCSVMIVRTARPAA